MATRINRAIELLADDQAIYYDGPHSGHVLTHAQGMEDAATWADYINVGMEHGAFDMTGLAAYMQGMVDAGPTRSGHRTPAVIVEAPVNGIDADTSGSMPGSFGKLWGAACMVSCCARRRTRRRSGPSWKAAAIRIMPPGWTCAAIADSAPARHGTARKPQWYAWDRYPWARQREYGRAGVGYRDGGLLCPV